MEDAFICRIATLTDMERKWEYEIRRHADDPGNWIVWKEGALANRSEGTLRKGLLRGRIWHPVQCIWRLRRS